MNRQEALEKLQAIVDKAGGFVKLENPLQFTVWCAGQWTEIEVCAIVSMAKDSHLNDRGELVTNAELYAIGKDYTAWNIDDFFNDNQMSMTVDRLGTMTVEIDYRMRIKIRGCDLKDIVQQFHSMDLSTKDDSAVFEEVLYVCDGKTMEDLTDKFNELS